MRLSLTAVAAGAVITALDFCLMTEEVFLDEHGNDDRDQIAAAKDVLARLISARTDVLHSPRRTL